MHIHMHLIPAMVTFLCGRKISTAKLFGSWHLDCALASLLVFTNHTTTLTNLDKLPAAPRSEQQSPSSSSAEEDTSSITPHSVITKAAFSAMLAGNFRLSGTKAKLYHPKLSNPPQAFFNPKFAVGSWLPRKQQEGVPHITPVSRQQRAPHNHRCDLYTSIMLPS